MRSQCYGGAFALYEYCAVVSCAKQRRLKSAGAHCCGCCVACAWQRRVALHDRRLPSYDGRGMSTGTRVGRQSRQTTVRPACGTVFVLVRRLPFVPNSNAPEQISTVLVIRVRVRFHHLIWSCGEPNTELRVHRSLSRGRGAPMTRDRTLGSQALNQLLACLGYWYLVPSLGTL